MDARRTPKTVAENVLAAIAKHGATLDGVAEAAHIDLPALNQRLDGVEEFSVSELVNVGGFLRVPAETLIEGVAA